MADVRCPMCGKTNPAEVETCQYCQARLAPQGSKPGSDAAANSIRPDSQPPEGADEADWLRELLGSEGGSEAAAKSDDQPAQDAEEDDKDWLERIRQRTQQEQDALSKIGPKPDVDAVHSQDGEYNSTASELEKWLKSLEEADGEQQPEAITPPAPPSPAPPAQQLSEEDDEWLRELTARIEASQSMEDHLGTFHGSQEDRPEQPPAEPADTGELPDWLQNLPADEASENIPAQPGAETAPAEEQAGWLTDFGQAGEESIDVSPDELPDWAKNLPDQAGETAEPAPEAASAEEIPEWLRELHNETPAAEALQESAAPPEELPDWLTAGEQAQPAEQSSASAEELPDWLASLQMEQPGEESPAPVQPEPSAPAEDLPDWVRNLQPVEEVPGEPAPAESLPDWMNEIALPESDDQTPSASAANETPAWMSEYSLPAEEEAAVSSAEDQALPDWLGDVQDVPGAETSLPLEAPESPAAPAVSQPETELPDWMKDIGALPADEDQAAAEPAADALPAAETPDWLKDIPSQPADAGSIPAEPAVADQPAPAAPDWLNDFGALPGAEGESITSDESISSWLDNLDEPEAPLAQTGMPAQDEAAPAEDIPDWLKAIKSGSQPDEEPGVLPGGQGLPDWMSNPQEIESKWEEPSQTEETPVESVSPYESSDMDALLADVTAPESVEQATDAEGEAESLEPVNLPTWLQAMRPVESAVSDIPDAAVADDQRIEKAGPLAGLRGVLPGEELASNYRKPPVYTNKLQVSEKQHLHSSLLEGILADEARVQPLPAEATNAHQTIMRLLVAALLIFLVYVPALTGFRLEVPADLSASQPGVAQAFQSISELAPGSNILLAADFEAGLSGEITTAALPVLKYLQTRQPNVFIASTVPSGPVLAEMLLSQSSITPVASFSYIAGGTHALKMIGTRATVEQPNPLRQVIPFPYGQGWNDPALQGIKDITGFQRILVLTDSLENARAWVEQVQPGLGPQTQILIISSAQVAPLVRTYAESGQVSGVVSGLLGGTAFEQLSQQSGPGSASWTAYQLTMGAVIILIIAGALITGISVLVQPEKSKRKV